MLTKVRRQVHKSQTVHMAAAIAPNSQISLIQCLNPEHLGPYLLSESSDCWLAFFPTQVKFKKHKQSQTTVPGGTRSPLYGRNRSIGAENGTQEAHIWARSCCQRARIVDRLFFSTRGKFEKHKQSQETVPGGQQGGSVWPKSLYPCWNGQPEIKAILPRTLDIRDASIESSRTFFELTWVGKKGQPTIRALWQQIRT